MFLSASKNEIDQGHDNQNLRILSLPPMLPWVAGRGFDLRGARAGLLQGGWCLSVAPASTQRNGVGSNHRMLSTHLNAFIRHGLKPEEFAEPPS